MHRRILALTFAALLGVGLSGCHERDYCDGGGPCECSSTSECYFGCDEDGCNPTCHDMDRCGAVCENDCNSLCYGVQEGSTSCGDDCAFECHDATACGLACGERCQFDCHDASRCGAIVGNGSSVSCNRVATCEIECKGSCQVECSGTCHVTCGSPGQCDLVCNGGVGPKTCGDGSLRCGDC